MKNLLEDPGTLIYVAFLAISLIGGYLKNLKKKRESQWEDDSETPDPINHRTEMNQAQQSRQEIASEKRIAEMKSKSELAMKAKNDRATRIRKRKEVVELSMESPSEERHTLSNHEQWNEDFDMKKAIIYSEILNPPYV